MTFDPEAIFNFHGTVKMDCPYCGHDALFNNQGQYSQVAVLCNDNTQSIHAKAALLRCSSCERPVMVSSYGQETNETHKFKNCKVYPPFIQQADKDIPDRIRLIFQEALNCAGVQAWNAVATMCRRAVQEAVVEKQGAGNTLYAQIEDLKKKGLLVNQLVDFAHTVRGIGRDGAHADPGFIDIDPQNADDAIEFCRQFFDYLYVVPQKLARQKAKRP